MGNLQRLVLNKLHLHPNKELRIQLKKFNFHQAEGERR